MRSLLREAYAVAGPAVQMTVGDLDYWRYQEADPDGVMESCALWVDDAGEAVGFAWPGVADGEHVIDLFAHPHHRDLYEPMYAWSEAWHLERWPSATVLTNGREDDAQVDAVLRQRGYERTGAFHSWYRVRPLDGPVDPPVLADGYTIRSGGRDDELYVSMHPAPTYRRELHFVAVAPDGTAAAWCVVWHDEANRIGLFEPVGCAEAHRRRGLASAVMTAGLVALQRLGATHALVGTGGGNDPAIRLYDSLGFEERGKSFRWRKTLSR